MYKTIFIVAGHGKSNGRIDPGTTYQDITERNLVVNIAKKLLTKFGDKAIGIGIDEDIDLNTKISKINFICSEQKLDYTNSLLISIHVDYFQSPSGVAAYHYRNSNSSKAYAQAILEGVSKQTNKKVRWNKPDTDSRFGSLGIVRITKPLAFLLECGSIKEDIEYLKNPELLVNSIYESIMKFAKWKQKKVTIDYESELTNIMDLVSSAWHDFDKIEQLSIVVKEKLHQANESIRLLNTPQ